LVSLLVLFLLVCGNGEKKINFNDANWNVIVENKNLPNPPKILSGLELKGGAFVPATDPNIVYSGRFNFSNPDFPTFSWSGSTINATFNGTSVAAAINDGSNYYTIYIDGQFTFTLMPTGDNIYQLAQYLPSGTHSVSIFKRTEAVFGTYSFGGFYLDQGASLLAPPPAPTRRIEVVGDSITCGYGDLGPNNCSSMQETEDEGIDYAQQVGKYFGAETHVICWSGSGFFIDYAPVVTQDIYLDTNGNGGAWDFSSWVPDAVIINIGTNDHSEGRNVTQWMEIYNSFIANEIRGNYGNAPAIFLGCGPMTNAYDPYVLQVVQDNINNGVYYVNLTVPSDECCLGCISHPTLVAQSYMAASAIETLSSVLGW